MSNKTPKGSAKKTKSAHRLIFLGFAAVVVVGLALYLYASFANLDSGSKANGDVQLKVENTKLLCVPSLPSAEQCRTILEVADTDATRIKGLSGRENMPENRGMLFISDNVEKQCFWMRDMKFSLDFVWLDENKQITQIKENIAPETYPEQFCSPYPDKYMIELNAGKASELGLKVGQKVTF